MDALKDFPLGIQYYRVIPPPAEWRDDFLHMKEIGIEVVKIEAVWSQIERTLGTYTWDELDGLMDTARETGLKILMTLSFESVPESVFRKSSAHVIDLERRPVPVQRWFAGVSRLACCWDHPEVRSAVRRFTETIVKRYVKHPALYCWDVFQEVDIPECTCQHTTRAYQEWLRRNFPNIEELNRVLGEHFARFADVEPPYTRHYEGQAYLLYTKFRLETLAERIRWLCDIVKKEDRIHRVTAHSHSGTLGLGFSPGRDRWDDWLVAKPLDFYGTSIHEMVGTLASEDLRAFAKAVANLEVTRSVARQKNYYWIAEISGGPACSAPRGYRRLDEGDLIFNLWTTVAHGAKGLFLWQFKPERYWTCETPSGWGLVNLDGTETYRTKEFRRFQDCIKKHRNLFLRLRTPQPVVGLLYSPGSQTMSDALQFVSYADAFFGAVLMLWINNVPFDVLRFEDELEDYKMVYAPMPWLLEECMVEAIRNFVKRGGTLIADGGLCRYTASGWLSAQTPGYGLAEELGVKEIDFTLIEKAAITTRHGVVYGCQERAWLAPGDNAVHGRWASGQPAIVRCRYGKGAFILTGTSLSSYFAHHDDVAQAGKCVKLLGLKPAILISPPGRVTARWQESDDARVLFLFNHGPDRQSVRIRTKQPCNNAKILWGQGLRRVGKSTLLATMPGKGVLIARFNR